MNRFQNEVSGAREPAPKLIYLAKRHARFDSGGFTARWRRHAALGMSQARWHNVLRYMHCDTADGIPATDGDFLCDGVALVWYRSEQARLNHVADEGARTLMKKDELDTFAGPVARFSVLTNPLVFKETVPPVMKLFVFWRSSSDDFLREWLACGQQWAARLAHDMDITGYAQNVPVKSTRERSDGLACGIDEISAGSAEPLIALAKEWGCASALPATSSLILTSAVHIFDRIDPAGSSAGTAP